MKRNGVFVQLNLNIIFSKFKNYLQNFSIVFFFLLFHCVYWPHFNYSFIYRWTCRLIPFPDCRRKSSVNMDVRVSLWQGIESFEFMSRSGKTGSYVFLFFSILRSLHTDFHSDYNFTLSPTVIRGSFFFQHYFFPKIFKFVICFLDSDRVR